MSGQQDDNEYHLARERVATRLGVKGTTRSSSVGFEERFAWLDHIACADRGIDDFFVPAGHAISEDVLNVCRGCSVRVDCLRYAYSEGISNGYFGGLSPGQRRTMDFDQALSFTRRDARRAR